MSNALEVIDLRKSYRSFSLTASFAIADGEVFALLGPNGSGKTTIIHTLLNVVRRDGGQVRFFGLDLDRHETAIKRRLGVFLEDARLFDNLRVEHLLRFHSLLYPTWNAEYANRLLAEFDIEANKVFKKLSKGMKAKVALTCALAPQPKLLILDEPTAGLDVKMRRLFVEKVREARRHFAPAILLTSHIMRDIEELADRIAFIEDGRIKLNRSLQEMRSWKIIEGVGRGKLSVTALGIRQNRNEAEITFKLLSDDESQVVAQLHDCEARMTSVRTPDLEEIYDLIIDTSA